MTWRKSKPVRRVVRWVALAAALAACGCSREAEVAPGEVVEGELATGEVTAYRLDLRGRTYARLRVAPRLVDAAEPDGPAPGEITLRVRAPGGETVVEAAGVRNRDGGVVAWVTGSAGRHRIAIENATPLGATSYRLEVEEVRPAQPGDRHRAAAETARAQAERLTEPDQRPQALATLERSLAEWRLAGDSVEAVGVLLHLADYEARADPDKALTRCEEALDLSDASGFAAGRIDALNSKGMLLRQREDYQGALAAYEQAREIARESGDLGRAAIVEFNRAVALRRHAPDLAPAAFDEAIAAAQRAGDAAGEAFALREIALLARERGDLGAAAERLEQAWSVAERAGDPEAQAAVADALGNLDRQRGRLAEALGAFERCLKLNEGLGRRAHLPEILLSLGAISLELRRPEEAWAYNERALEVGESLGDLSSQSESLVELGAVLFRQRRFERAESFFRRALATAEQIGAGRERERRLAAARYRIGLAVLELGRASDAVVELRRALDTQRSIGDRIGEVQTTQVLGTALSRLGDRAAALEHLSAALALNGEVGDPLRTVDILYRLAEVQAVQDQATARTTLEEAIALGQRVRAGLVADPFRARFSESSRRHYELYIQLLVHADDGPAAFAASEEGRARALLDLVTDARVDLGVEVPPSLRRELDDVDSRIAWLQTRLRDALLPGGSQRAAEALSEELERTEREWWRVEAAIRGRSRKYEELRSPEIVGVDEVRRSLPAGRALLEYWVGDRGSYVFVLTRSTFARHSLPPAAEIGARVAALRSSILSLEPPALFARPAHELYRAIVAPALAAASSAGEPIQELVIVPDGPLHLLPFEVLLTAAPEPGARFEDLPYLLREVSISYAPSATVLASLDRGREASDVAGEERREPGLRLLAFADPAYDRPLPLDCPEAMGDSTRSAPSDARVRSRQVGKLRGSREEVRELVDLYGSRARAYYGAEASEDRLKSDPALAVAERIHIAVHGVVCEPFPERSALVFALEDGPEDGVLQTREVFGLDIGADLVVLSACETGLGRLVSGEGVVGLARAFFYAGAPSLVVSLWQVPDGHSTAQFMVSFYRHLDQGHDKATALQRARSERIAAGGPTAAPFYWAPFVLLGSRETRSSSALGG